MQGLGVESGAGVAELGLRGPRGERRGLPRAGRTEGVLAVSPQRPVEDAPGRRTLRRRSEPLSEPWDRGLEPLDPLLFEPLEPFLRDAELSLVRCAMDVVRLPGARGAVRPGASTRNATDVDRPKDHVIHRCHTKTKPISE